MSRLMRPLRLAGKVLLWLLVFAVAALPAVFLNTMFGYFPCLLLALLLLVSFGCLIRLKGRLNIETDFSDVWCVRGESVDIGLELVNRSRIFCPKASARIIISDLFGQTSTDRMVDFTIAGRERIEFGFAMDMPHIGVYSIGLEGLEIYDFFGAFHRTVPVSGRFSAAVLPRIRSMEELYRAQEVLAEAARDTKTMAVGGTDYTGVREYALGDPMKQIHWKLSAHSHSYMTKLQESSRQQEFTVVLDFAAEENRDAEQLMDLNDCLIETALSLVEEVSRHDAGYALLYCDRARNIVRVSPSGRSDDLELVRSFCGVTPAPGPEFPDAGRIVQQEGRNQNRSTNLIIVTSRATPELLRELEQVRQQRRSPELYLVVPAQWNSRQLEEAAAPLRQLEAAEIPYYLISTAGKLQGGGGQSNTI